MFRLSRPSSPLDSEGNNGNSNSATCRQQVSLRKSQQQLSRHHPHVKLPPRLEDKSKQEQIRRCTDRFQSYPSTVDTLLRALTTILQHPTDTKYRRIDTRNAGYQKSLASVPGAEPLLMALGFERRSDHTLVMPSIHLELLQMAIETLQQTKRVSPAYQHAKAQQILAHNMTHHLTKVPTPEELERRQELLAQVPREPPAGRSAVLMIQWGRGGDSTSGTTLQRRFDGDDTWGDVLHWLAGSTSGEVWNKLVTTQEWSLVDVNRPAASSIIDASSPKGHSKTLQHLGFWPSGRLQLVPTTATTMPAKMTDMGPSRGLGSAHDSMF